MISGRGLGHTGGTLDKLDSIPGYSTAARYSAAAPGLARRRLRDRRPDRRLGAGRPAAVRDSRCHRHGRIDPADHRQHPVEEAGRRAARPGDGREVSATAPSAATAEMALALARSIVEVANGAGLPTRALITDMNQVLGHACGNTLEVLEAVEFLRGEHRAPRLLQVTRLLCAELLLIGGLATDERRGAAARGHGAGRRFGAAAFRPHGRGTRRPGRFLRASGPSPAGRAVAAGSAGAACRLGLCQGDARHRPGGHRTRGWPPPRQRPHRPARRLQRCRVDWASASSAATGWPRCTRPAPRRPGTPPKCCRPASRSAMRRRRRSRC